MGLVLALFEKMIDCYENFYSKKPSPESLKKFEYSMELIIDIFSEYKKLGNKLLDPEQNGRLDDAI